jgi:gluconokinase
MGVSGSGKSTVGWLLAERLGLVFVDADDLHPPANVTKMRAGMALDDDDRGPWLKAVADRMRQARHENEQIVLACSALKRSYRDELRRGDAGAVFVYLDVPRSVLEHRLQQRSGHFMPASLLRSQFVALEVPGRDERSVRVGVEGEPAEVAERAAEALAELPDVLCKLDGGRGAG